MTHPIPQHVVVQGLSCLQPDAFLWVFIRQKQPIVIGCRKETQILSESLEVCFLAYIHMWIFSHYIELLLSQALALEGTFKICALASLSMLTRSVGLWMINACFNTYICSKHIRLHTSKCHHWEKWTNSYVETSQSQRHWLQLFLNVKWLTWWLSNTERKSCCWNSLCNKT